MSKMISSLLLYFLFNFKIESKIIIDNDIGGVDLANMFFRHRK